MFLLPVVVVWLLLVLLTCPVSVRHGCDVFL
jgi:hypothetical protein